MPTAFATLATVFPSVEAWRLHGGDLLLVASAKPIDHDLERIRRRAAEEPYATALRQVWGVDGAEGFYSAYLAGPELARRLREQAAGELSTDDRPRIEFGFIRNLGSKFEFRQELFTQLVQDELSTDGAMRFAAGDERRNEYVRIDDHPHETCSKTSSSVYAFGVANTLAASSMTRVLTRGSSSAAARW